MHNKKAQKEINRKEKAKRLAYEKRHLRRINKVDKIRETQEQLAEEVAAQTIKIPPYRRGR